MAHHDARAAHLPRVGQRLPAFALPSTSGAVVRVRAYTQRQPVLLAFTHGRGRGDVGCLACAEWLRRLAGARAAVEEVGAALLIVVPEPVGWARRLQDALDLAFPPLADADGTVAAIYVPSPSAVAVYAADRYGYCLARWVATEAAELPSPDAALVPVRDAEQGDCGCGLPAWPDEERAE
ncbi:MAG: redoxin domain-containing protein [Ktedonobacterales bacterium]|nr:redoxin domain-containing protein [Ktedonobacterales bacterium]